MELVEIDDRDELYRRIAWEHVNDDGTVNSGAYKLRGKPDQNISVDLARLTTQEQCLAQSPELGRGLGVLVARDPRNLGFSVCHNPLLENLAHSLIQGQNDKGKCRQLAELTKLLVRPKRREET